MKATVSSLDVLSSAPSEVTIAVALVLLIGAGVAMKNGSSSDSGPSKKETEPEPKPIDVSIPYDAAARLAYDNWRVEQDKGDFNVETYKAFKEIYTQLAVTEVVVKKKSREIESLHKQLESL